MKLTILQYNNYFNRVMKKKNADAQGRTYLSQYTNPSGTVYYTLPSAVNFNKNDGVNTEHVINYETSGGNVVDDNVEYDYAIVSEDDGLIVSRWFIIESKWTRKGQRKLSLRRDLLVDYWNDYKNAPAFIEKGLCASDGSDSFIFNSENVSFSQVLKEQHLLKGGVGDSATGYIVGFQDKSYGGNINVANAGVPSYETEEDLPFAQEWLYGTIKEHSFISQHLEFYLFGFWDDENGCSRNFFYSQEMGDNRGQSKAVETTEGGFYTAGQVAVTRATYQYVAPTHQALMWTATTTDINNDLSTSRISAPGYISNYNNFVCQIGGKGYKFKRKKIQSRARREVEGIVTAAHLTSYFSQIEGAYTISGRFPQNAKGVYIEDIYDLVAEPYPAANAYLWPAAAELTNTSYNVWYMVADDDTKRMAGEIAAALGSYIYDIQLFPYKPPTQATPTIRTVNGKTVYYIKDISRTFTSQSIILTNSLRSSIKLSSMSDLIRITSPDHSSSWDISPRQNGMTSSMSFNISFSLMPNSSYIHIRPLNFSNLYGSIMTEGSDTKEIRGLVWQGNFSLPMTSDSWAQYKINNSSYYDAFNRQIENLTATQNYQRINEIAGASVGVLSGAVTGAAMGGGIGAAVGAVGAAATGVVDIMLNENMRKEQLDYTKDMFGYQMQNIKAQPDTLRSVGAQATENFLFPYIQLYQCTEDEATAWGSKETYNAWTIGRISTFATMHSLATASGAASKYYKGQLIRTSSTDAKTTEDTHLWTEIGSELFKGVYDYT